MQQKQTDVDINQLFTHGSSTQAPANQAINRFLLKGEAIFTLQDIDIIETFGLSGWAIQQDIIWQDQTLTDWPYLPAILRNTIITEVLGPLRVPIRYALPFRYVGRVMTFAILMEAPPAIRVTENKRPASQLRVSEMLVDPPVPFLTLGLASPEIVAKHARCVRQILTGGGHNNEGILIQLPDILQQLCGGGTITKSEAFYYLTGMHALISGSWRQVQENFGLIAVEHLIKHSNSRNPLQAQLLAQAHLIDGQSIQWPPGEDPFEVDLSYQD